MSGQITSCPENIFLSVTLASSHVVPAVDRETAGPLMMPGRQSPTAHPPGFPTVGGTVTTNGVVPGALTPTLEQSAAKSGRVPLGGVRTLTLLTGPSLPGAERKEEPISRETGWHTVAPSALQPVPVS